MRIPVLLCLLLLSWSSIASPSAVSVMGAVGTATDADLDAYIGKAMVDWKQPGLSIVVVKDGKPVYMKGFGVRSIGGGAVDADTRFGMMSTTKAMTALAVAMLVDEGKLGWDDPVQKTLPWFQMPDAGFSRKVTVRDTLRHNAGLGGDADLLWATGMFTSRELLERVQKLTPGYAPYSNFGYSNVMYQVAGELVSTASGIPWDQFIETRIMSPLGMARSTATLAAMAAQGDENVSLPHFEIDGTLRQISDVTVDAVPAAGAAWSTARDAARWMQFLLAEGEVNGERLVTEANFREMFKPQVIIPDAGFYPTAKLTKPQWMTYGLGWFQQDYRGQHVAMHTGSMDGRTAIVGLIPERELGVFVFGNSDHVELRHALMWKVFDLDLDSDAAAGARAPSRDWSAELLALYGAMKDESTKARAEAEGKRVKGTRPSHALAKYAGAYTHPAFGEVQVVNGKGGLTMRVGAMAENAGPLGHWHYDTFSWANGDGRYGKSPVQFELGANAEVAALTLNGGALRFVRVPAAKASESKPGG